MASIENAAPKEHNIILDEHNYNYYENKEIMRPYDFARPYNLNLNCRSTTNTNL